MKQHRGQLLSKGMRFAIVVAQFNEFITKRLLDSAISSLEKTGVSNKNIEVAWVPGALEIPVICKKFAQQKKFDAVIALGCVIRGETYHFECVSLEVTRGISQVSLETGVPIATAVLTVDNLEQAIDRAGLKAGNKGADAALAAIEMASLADQLKPKSKATRKKKK